MFFDGRILLLKKRVNRDNTAYGRGLYYWASPFPASRTLCHRYTAQRRSDIFSVWYSAPRYHHLLVFLARLCRLQTLSKWLFQILVALFLFQLQKAYFPRSKFHALFLTLRFPSFSSFLIPPLKGLFLLFLISSSNTKKGRFLLGFSSLNSLKRLFLSILTSFTHLNLWKAGFTWVAELPEEKDKHLRSNIQSQRQLQLQLSTCRWFNFPSLDCHYFQYLPSILNFNIDNIHDISITWK